LNWVQGIATRAGIGYETTGTAALPALGWGLSFSRSPFSVLFIRMPTLLSEKIQDALNSQINLEFSSSYHYLAMSAFFEASSLPGMAAWMRVQSEEERTHAMKLFDHLSDRGGTVVLQEIAKPQLAFDTPLSVFEAALEGEQRVTRAINSLYALAQAEQDYPSQVLLQWFITEQVEEEKTAQQAIDQLKMADNNPGAMLMLDQLLGARPAEEPATGQ
jgi:ferritin